MEAHENDIFEAPISPELCLVDEDLAARARLLPPHPFVPAPERRDDGPARSPIWLVPAPVDAAPQRPSIWQRLAGRGPMLGALGGGGLLLVVAYVTAGPPATPHHAAAGGVVSARPGAAAQASSHPASGSTLERGSSAGATKPATARKVRSHTATARPARAAAKVNRAAKAAAAAAAAQAAAAANAQAAGRTRAEAEAKAQAARAAKAKAAKAAGGAVVPVSLSWSAVAGAKLYDVIVWQGTTRVLDLWPTTTHVTVPATWTYRGVTYTRSAATHYLWFVYPAFGSKSSLTYGALVKSGSF